MRSHAPAPKEWILRNPQGHELVLRLEAGASVTVGRDLGSDLPVLDAGISRHHASFSLEGDELWLEDLHSQNGTFVNTERVRRARVLPGDIITFGRVPLMLSARAQPAAELDPVRRLPQESLAQLVHLLKELGTEKGGAMLFQKLLELALRAVKADRGLVLLWEERRDHFHTVAASPQELFQSGLRLVSHPLALSIVRSAKARLLGDPLAAGAGSALAAPVTSGTGAVGILYLDRAASRQPFQSPELELLTAFTWAAAATLQAAREVRPVIADDGPQQQRPLPRSQRPLLEGRMLPLVDGALGTGGASLLHGLEQHLLARMARLAASTASDAARLEETTACLHAARLGIEGVRRLVEDGAGALETIHLDRLAGELAAVDRSRRRYTLSEGGGLSVLADSQALLLVLRLYAGEIAGPRREAGEPEMLSLSAAPSDEEGLVLIRLEASAAAGALESGSAPPRDRFLCDLAGRLAQELLHGKAAADPAGRAVDVYVPQPAASWRETLLLRPSP